jgi:hypothetical protein
MGWTNSDKLYKSATQAELNSDKRFGSKHLLQTFQQKEKPSSFFVGTAILYTM